MRKRTGRAKAMEGDESRTLLPNGYRVGDPVWHFRAKSQAIEQGYAVPREEFRQKAPLYNPKDSDVYARFGFEVWRMRCDEAFPTREALCEHYRKIFE